MQHIHVPHCDYQLSHIPTIKQIGPIYPRLHSPRSVGAAIAASDYVLWLIFLMRLFGL
ncbi:MAG: hypothetical protein RMY28_021830 [Nostoc sp. ChiSLP01]